MKDRKKEIIAIIIVLIIQTVIFVIAGVNKSYIHMDEAYSLGLANYDKVEIQDNEDFYNKWHNSEYYEDYLAVQDKDIGKFSQVYENQKNDVHPPIYYLLLRIAMGTSLNHYSKWPGIILNIIIYGFITIFMYLILQKLFEGRRNYKEKSIILALVSSITMASITNAIYIRMYALSTLNILIITYLHIKLLDSEKIDFKLLVAIGISALIGSLTHYYYLFYLTMLYIAFAIKYIKDKKYKNLIYYTVTMVIAGILSLAIFPYSIQHMFFGYRGQGVLSKLADVKGFSESIKEYIKKVDKFSFNKLLGPIILAIVIFIACKLFKKEKILSEKNKYIKYIILSTMFYFFLVAVASPWIELRYIMSICGLIFVIVMFYFEETLCNLVSEKANDIIVFATLIIVLLAPIVYKIEPEVMYSDKKEIVSKLENDLNVPALYLFNSNCNRFLDDILLFSILDESYVAKDINCTEENIQNILQNKDISKGIIIFINEGQENDTLLQTIKNVTNLSNCTYLKRLNAADVYYLN